MNLAAASAIAVRDFKLDRGHGYVDYMLFLDGHPVGVCEAKPAGTALIGVEHQVKRYVEGILPALEPSASVHDDGCANVGRRRAR